MGIEGGELWPAVREELWRVRILPPLAVARASADWRSKVAASDASHRGRGVRERETPVEEI
eukprot:4226397-Pyramimonas_sp.AAC.1